MEKELKRMNYFNGLFLESEDYNQDKEYQRRLQGFHNRYLHTWGIISGLNVKPVTDSNMEVYVTEGAAIDLVEEGLDGSNIRESISRQLLIYEGHPNNPIDLSEYNAGDNIYIFASYYECNADWNSERGQGEEIHIWELGRLSFDIVKPDDDKKVILLARVVPREVSLKSGDNTYIETVIDSTCIFDTDIDGSSLRVYAGPYAKILGLEKFIFKISDDLKNMPFVNSRLEEPSNIGDTVSIEDTSTTEGPKIILDVISDLVNFTHDVTVTDDIEFGQLVSKKKDGTIKSELGLAEKYLQLNSKDDDSIDSWGLKDGGMDVFRGGLNTPDARIVWTEFKDTVGGIWKAGLENKLSPIVFGNQWETLIKGGFNDGLHRHSNLSSKRGTVLSADNEGNLSLTGDLIVNSKNIQSKSGNIAWYGTEKKFGNIAMDGPVLAGSNGGLLGTTSEGQKAVLSWNEIGKVGIGSVNLSSTDDELDIAESSRMLIGSNPIRVTSRWTAFPDLTMNQAEICNDTTYHKALMLVGNQSAGQGRKVAIWDRLDVNGLLYVNGNMQMLNELTVSAGQGNNGIVFPSDPGGGYADGAWIKYYPRNGEACTLEIGTSNDGDDNILLMPSGNVGIDTWIPDTNVSSWTPNDKLDVNGSMRILSATNPIRFTDKWSGFADQSSNYAEICNDTSSTYQSLMIVGNRSAGYERRVSIWDDLDVNGVLNAKGNFRVAGAIIPGVGNCEVKGILFPSNPKGGAGDSAWIRYYSDTIRGGGDNMTLEIGISNDNSVETVTTTEWISNCPYPWVTNPCGSWRTTTRTFNGNSGDRLRFHASGGTYVEGGFYITSSKEYKENISDIGGNVIKEAIDTLEPVEYNFKGDNSRTTLGFIAENVPDSLAAADKKAISPMEIMAILVGEVKEQAKALSDLKKKIAALKNKKK